VAARRATENLAQVLLIAQRSLADCLTVSKKISDFPKTGKKFAETASFLAELRIFAECVSDDRQTMAPTTQTTRDLLFESRSFV